MEMYTKGDQWNKRFRTVQVYCLIAIQWPEKVSNGFKVRFSGKIFWSEWVNSVILNLAMDKAISYIYDGIPQSHFQEGE